MNPFVRQRPARKKEINMITSRCSCSCTCSSQVTGVVGICSLLSSCQASLKCIELFLLQATIFTSLHLNLLLFSIFRVVNISDILKVSPIILGYSFETGRLEVVFLLKKKFSSLFLNFLYQPLDLVNDKRACINVMEILIM